MGQGNLSQAFAQRLYTHFFIDPLLYPVEWHPTRVCNIVMLLTLAHQIYMLLSTGGPGLEILRPFEPDLGLVCLDLTAEVARVTQLCHGPGSSFAVMWKLKVEQAARVSMMPGLTAIFLPEQRKKIEVEWEKLRVIAGLAQYKGTISS